MYSEIRKIRVIRGQISNELPCNFGVRVEQILAANPGARAYFWATHAGAELDLLLIQGNRRAGYEFKYTETPRTTKSMHAAIADLKLDELSVIYPGAASFPLGERIFARPLQDAIRRGLLE